MNLTKEELLSILYFYKLNNLSLFAQDNKINLYNDIISNHNISVNNNVEYLFAKKISSNKDKSQIKMDNRSKNNKSDILALVQNMADKVKSITELKDIIDNFKYCNLKDTANNTVFADGDIKSDIMIIGEAPGKNEDLQGKPFCGDSGKLLNNMFNAINITRDQLYISNNVFWRPVGNRNPSSYELDLLRPLVEKHIAIIKPKLLILMGAISMNNLLSHIIGKNAKITQERGKIIKYRNKYLTDDIDCLIMFHPSYLMRNGITKKYAWLDLMLINKILYN